MEEGSNHRFHRLPGSELARHRLPWAHRRHHQQKSLLGPAPDRTSNRAGSSKTKEGSMVKIRGGLVIADLGSGRELDARTEASRVSLSQLENRYFQGDPSSWITRGGSTTTAPHHRAMRAVQALPAGGGRDRRRGVAAGPRRPQAQGVAGGTDAGGGGARARPRGPGEAQRAGRRRRVGGTAGRRERGLNLHGRRGTDGRRELVGQPAMMKAGDRLCPGFGFLAGNRLGGCDKVSLPRGAGRCPADVGASTQ